MKKPGENILEGKYWDFSIDVQFGHFFVPVDFVLSFATIYIFACHMRIILK